MSEPTDLLPEAHPPQRPRARFTVRGLMAAVLAVAVSLWAFEPPPVWFTRPDIYWYTILVAGALLGAALHRAARGGGAWGAIAGGLTGAGAVGVLAYLGAVDRGGPLQYGLREMPGIASCVLAVQGIATGGAVAAIGFVLDIRAGVVPAAGAPGPSEPEERQR